MTFRWCAPRIALAPACVMVAAALVTLGCRGGDEAVTPPPNHVASVGAACDACAPSEAVHPCPARPPGAPICQGIPAAKVGDSMILCGRGVSSEGRIGTLRWSSSNPAVASVTPTTLTVTHCVNEVANARLEAKSVGSATITLEELSGTAVVSSASAAVTVKAPE